MILKYDVIHDALKVICNKNIKCPRIFGDIGSLGDMGTGRNLAKNLEIAYVFSSDMASVVRVSNGTERKAAERKVAERNANNNRNAFDLILCL